MKEDNNMNYYLDNIILYLGSPPTIFQMPFALVDRGEELRILGLS